MNIFLFSRPDETLGNHVFFFATAYEENPVTHTYSFKPICIFGLGLGVKSEMIEKAKIPIADTYVVEIKKENIIRYLESLDRNVAEQNLQKLSDELKKLNKQETKS